MHIDMNVWHLVAVAEENSATYLVFENEVPK